NTLGHALVSDSQCAMPCSANSSELCGGRWFNSIYSVGTQSTSTGTGYLGCYTDSSTRALPTELASSSATIEACIAAAKAGGFTYAGLQYGGQCFAGNVLGYSQVGDSQCSMSCSAKSSEMCGGSWRNSVYSSGLSTSTASIAIAVKPESTSVAACQSVSLSATVTGTTDTAVTWSVLEGSSGGSVSAGVYTAPSTPGTYHVVATSQADPTRSAQAAITVSSQILSVAVSPDQTTVAPGGTVQFTATVTTTCGKFAATQAVTGG
ncbi:MAG TPA: WSC domain-containing protein, partial [Anaeromyxobacteraceae bacterium]|nr:WSC domain-containing protein [Anaeromyxobacteraceae bacterium]